MFLDTAVSLNSVYAYLATQSLPTTLVHSTVPYGTPEHTHVARSNDVGLQALEQVGEYITVATGSLAPAPSPSWKTIIARNISETHNASVAGHAFDGSQQQLLRYTNQSVGNMNTTHRES